MVDLSDHISKTLADPTQLELRLKELLERIPHWNTMARAFLRWYVSAETISRRFQALTRKKMGQPLFGSVFVVKDSITVEGQPLTLGVDPPFRDHVECHAGVVEQFLNLGATLLGSTSLDPLSLSSSGKNEYFGEIRNPSYPDCASLGSSGGCAAAVAGRLCDFGVGTDFGGSVRAPAAACGVVGLKASTGLLSSTGASLVSGGQDELGIITASLSDLRVILNVLCKSSIEENVKCIFSLHEEDKAYLSSEIRNEYEMILEVLDDRVEVRELPCPIASDEFLTYRKIVTAPLLVAYIEALNLSGERLPVAARAILQYQATLSISAIEGAGMKIAAARAQIETLLSRSSLILTPTLSHKPVREREHTASLRYLPFANLMGFPALTFPVIRNDSGGWPCSYQLVGPLETDPLLVSFGLELELALSRVIH